MKYGIGILIRFFMSLFFQGVIASLTHANITAQDFVVGIIIAAVMAIGFEFISYAKDHDTPRIHGTYDYDTPFTKEKPKRKREWDVDGDVQIDYPVKRKRGQK